MSSTQCETFNPQRFRPNFCKTCMKTKAEHPSDRSALSASAPEVIAEPKVTIATPLKLGGELKKPPVGAPSQQQNNATSMKKRRLSTVNSQRNLRFSRQLKTGFVAKQQKKNETPNANKFFLQALRGLLSEGIGLSANETEDLVRRVIASNALPENPNQPSILISKKRTSYLERFMNTTEEFLEEQRNLRKIITVQSLIRRYLVTKRFGSMTPESLAMLRKRNAIYSDLVRTEKNFVESTEDLISRFIVRLRQSDVVAPNESAFIFSNIEVVAEEHRALLRRIISAGDGWPFIGNIGAIFLDIKSLLNAISVYVSNFKNAMNEIERISLENPRFKAFCDQQMAEDDFDITMSLTMPVNRIAQYEYVLRNLADHTPEGSKEREDCENAFAVLAQSSLVVQTSLVESGETARILAVQRKMKGDGPVSLIKPGRRLLDEYKMKKHSVCLFTDLVVVSRLPPAKGFGTGRVHKQKEDFNKVKKIANLNVCSLTEPKNDKFLELHCGDETFKLMPLNSTLRNEFIQVFRNAVDELNRAKVFGVSLADTVAREKPPDGIPLVLRKCTSFIEEHYLTQAGIFRVAGATKETTLLRETFDRGGEDAQNLSLGDKSVHSLCDIIKSYLRALPEPLLSYNVYNPLVQLMKDQSNDKAAQVTKIKSELKTHTPEVSLKVLCFLVQFLQKVSAHSEENKMTNSNLSIVFGPTLLWPRENTLESAMDMPYVNNVIQLLLDSPSEIIPTFPE